MTKTTQERSVSRDCVLFDIRESYICERCSRDICAVGAIDMPLMKRRDICPHAGNRYSRFAREKEKGAYARGWLA